MKRILVIDDLRVFEPLEGEQIVTKRTLQEGELAFVNDGPWAEVWLDHDLGYDERGYRMEIRPLVLAIEEAAYLHHSLFDVGMFVIITDNDPGRKWMIAALSPYYPVEVGKREYTIDWKATPA